MSDNQEYSPPPQTSPPNRESFRNEVYADLDAKIGIVRGLKNTVDTVSVEQPVEEVREKLNDYLKESFGKLPEGTADKLTRIKTIKRRLQELDEKTDDNDDYIQNDEEYGELILELDNFNEDKNLQFAENLHDTVAMLVSKNEQVIKLKEGGDIATALSNLREKISQSEIKETRIGPFSISVLLQPDIYRSVATKNTMGIHLTKSIFNVIDASGPNVDATIEHENIHNLLDDASTFKIKAPAKTLDELFTLYEQGKSDTTKALGKNELSNLKASNLIDQLRGEFVAHVQFAEKSDFHNSGNGLAGMLRSAFESSSSNTYFLNRVNSLSTFGVRINEAINFLKAKEMETQDPLIKSKCSELRTGLLEYITESIQQLRTNLEIATRINEDAHQDVHAAMYILPPSKFNHIRGYMKYKFGESAVSQNERSYYMIEASGDPQSQITRTAQLLRANNGYVHPADLAILKDTFIQDLPSILSDFTGLDISGFNELITNLNTVALRYTGEPLNSEEIQRATSQFIVQTIEDSFIDNFASLSTTYENLPVELKSQFASQLLDYVGHDLIEMLNIIDDTIHRSEDIVQNPIWDQIKIMGLEKEARKRLGI